MHYIEVSDDVECTTSYLMHEKERKRLIENVLAGFQAKQFPWKQVLVASETLSHAEINQACRDAIKATILSDRTMKDVGVGWTDASRT